MIESNVLNFAADEFVAGEGSINDMAAPEWSNQMYLTLQLMSL